MNYSFTNNLIWRWIIFYILFHSSAGILFLIVPPLAFKFNIVSYSLALLASALFFLFIFFSITIIRIKFIRILIASLWVFLITYLIFANIATYFLLGSFLDFKAIYFVLNDPEYLINSVKAYGNFLNISGFIFVFTFFMYLIFPTVNFYFNISKPQNKVVKSDNIKSFLYLRRDFIAVLSLPVLSYICYKRLGRENYKSRFFTGKATLLPYDGALAVAIYDSTKTMDKIFMRALDAWNYTIEEKIFNHLPSTVILFVNESWGRQSVGLYQSPYGDSRDCMPLLTQLVNENTARAIIFKQHFANSNNTTLSMLSLFTGVDPAEPLSVFAAMPNFYSYFKKIGYKTVYLSTQKYSMDPISKKYFSEDLDIFKTGEDFHETLINDTGIDESITLTEVKNVIKTTEPDTPLLIIYNTNAMHVPFQTHGKLFPPQLTGTPQQKSKQIIDFTIAEVVQTLKQKQRWENSLVWLTGDHGETDNFNHARPRMQNFHDEILKIPNILFYPSEWNQKHQFKSKIKNLRANAELMNTQNLDIIPTLLNLGGFNKNISTSNKNISANFSGSSLVNSIEKDRLIYSVNGNFDGISQATWGAGIIRKEVRLLLSTGYGIDYYKTSNDPFQKNNLWSFTPAEEKKFWIEVIRSKKQIFKLYSIITKI